MEVLDPKDPSTERTNGAEIRLKARSMSRGVAIGHVVCLHGSNRQFFKIEIPVIFDRIYPHDVMLKAYRRY